MHHFPLFQGLNAANNGCYTQAVYVGNLQPGNGYFIKAVGSEFVQMLHYELPDLNDRMLKPGRRNISPSTVAPTGTESMLSQTSLGIGPYLCCPIKGVEK